MDGTHQVAGPAALPLCPVLAAETHAHPKTESEQRATDNRLISPVLPVSAEKFFWVWEVAFSKRHPLQSSATPT